MQTHHFYKWNMALYQPWTAFKTVTSDQNWWSLQRGRDECQQWSIQCWSLQTNWLSIVCSSCQGHVDHEPLDRSRLGKWGVWKHCRHSQTGQLCKIMCTDGQLSCLSRACIDSTMTYCCSYHTSIVPKGQRNSSYIELGGHNSQVTRYELGSSDNRSRW